jgi:bifunctional DNase/RNase
VVLDSKTNTPVVVLLEVNGERKLPIWIGPSEASAISVRLNGVELDRPLTHDLATSFIDALGGRVRAARIHRHEGKTYFAEVVLERDGEFMAVDSRPSDAIAIALRTGADILVADHLFRPREPRADVAATRP